MFFGASARGYKFKVIYVEKNAPKSPYVCEKLILKSAYLDNGFQQACKAAIFFGGEFSLFGEFF